MDQHGSGKQTRSKQADGHSVFVTETWRLLLKYAFILGFFETEKVNLVNLRCPSLVVRHIIWIIKASSKIRRQNWSEYT